MGKKEAKINPLDAVMRQVFEWVQNLQELLWSDEEIADRLTRIMKRSFAEVLNIS
jgi:glutamate dehydrogenase/leucine dehydrogenase